MDLVAGVVVAVALGCIICPPLLILLIGVLGTLSSATIGVVNLVRKAVQAVKRATGHEEPEKNWRELANEEWDRLGW